MYVTGVEPSNLSHGGERSLCKLVVDWMESVADEKSVELLAENVSQLCIKFVRIKCDFDKKNNCMKCCTSCWQNDASDVRL